jgi:hypothetical protein
MYRIYAHFLPQFEPNDFNDDNWGKGFTEWTNVALSRPLFDGHIQPQIPGQLGFYDLRVKETRIKQEELAYSHGIEGFIIWDYWLGGGKRLLDNYLQYKLSTPEQTLPFMLAWANHDWKGVFFGSKSTLIKQKYLGVEDYVNYFHHLLPAFSDKRYARVGDYIPFYIYKANDIPDLKIFVETWNELAREHLGSNGFYFIGEHISVDSSAYFFLSAIAHPNHRRIDSYNRYAHGNKYVNHIRVKLAKLVQRRTYYTYNEAMKYFVPNVLGEKDIPVIVPNWDTTPRLGKKGVVLHGSTPELFMWHLRDLFNRYDKAGSDSRIVFLKSWNEWAEGNYIEPCWRYQDEYLKTLKTVIDEIR